MSTQPQDMSNNRYTSSVDDVREAINNDNVYCLLPRQCREIFTISFPKNKISTNQIESAIIKTLETSMPRSTIFILSMNKLSSQNDIVAYSIIFITVSKELINKLFLAGIKTVNFYIGYSENKNEYPLFREPPSNDKIAMINKEGIKLPYKASIHLNNK